MNEKEKLNKLIESELSNEECSEMDRRLEDAVSDIKDIYVRWRGNYKLDEHSLEHDAENIADAIGGEVIQCELNKGGYNGPHSGTNPPRYIETEAIVKIVVRGSNLSEVDNKVREIEEEYSSYDEMRFGVDFE